ncbi:MAG: TldD/PmbA family protein [Candidatus Njordarchaeia archaeon]
MEDLFREIIDYGSGLGASFVELRYQEIKDFRINVKNENVDVFRTSSVKGVGVRVVADGAWGFSSTSFLDKDSLMESVKNAVDMAKGSAKMIKRRVGLADVDIVEDTVKAEVKTNPLNVDPEEKLSYVMEINKNLLGNKKVKSVESSYGDQHVYQIYVNSEGSLIKQEKIYVFFYTRSLAVENGVRAPASESIGSTKGYDVILEKPPEKITSILSKRMENQLKAKTARGGVFPAVISPNVIGLFTHEGFGHLSEADLAFSGAVTMQKIGQKVASDIVTIVDDGTLPNGFGTFKYDDEGVKTQKTIVVKDGRLVSFLYNRELAKAFENILRSMNPNALDIFNVKPTGNARAENFRVSPIIRMRNTYIEPGDYSFEEMIEDIKYGYYLVAPLGGQANLDGTFQGGIQEAYEIANGDIGEPVRNISFSGNTLENLMKIEAVGKDFEIRSGYCGKGQTAFVGLGGPHVKIRELVIG